MIIILLSGIAVADFYPYGNIVMNNQNITGANMINATIYYGNGSQLTGITTSEANSSEYWDNLNTFNISQMENSNGTLNILISWLESLFISDTDEGNLNVNRSDYWDNLNSYTDIPHATPSNGDNTHFSLADEIYDWVIGLNYKTLTEIVTSIGNFSAWDKDYSDLINKPTNLTEFTDDLGDRGYTHLSNFTDDIGVSSDWDELSDVPTATPSNGDTTHLSTADQIYDWVTGLGYITDGNTNWDNSYGFITNTVSDLTNYYLKTETYNKSETYSQAEVLALNSSWNYTVNCNTSGVCAGGDVAYMNYQNSGNMTADNYYVGSNRLNSSHIIDHDGHSVKDTFNHIINRGVVSEINITLTGGLGVSWTAGEIYDSSTESFIEVNAGSGTLTDNQVNYLKYTGTSTLELSTSSSSNDEVLVASFATIDGMIAGYRKTDLLDTSLSSTQRGLRTAFPNRIIEGMSVYEDTDGTYSLDVIMDAGKMIKDGIEEMNPTTIYSRTLPLMRLFHSGGNWTKDSNAEIDTTYYDNGTDLVNIPSNKWVKSYFVYAHNELGWVYPTSYYNSKAQAEASSLSPIPPGLSMTPKLTAVIYQQGDTDFSNAVWQDIRPGISEESFNIVTDHGALSGLSDDDHPQYLLKDGNRELTGNWATGDYNITTTNGYYTGKTLWNNIQNKFITAVDNSYIYMDGTTATLNETKLNNTITDLDTDTNCSADQSCANVLYTTDEYLGGLSCSDAQIPKWNNTASAWECEDDETGAGGTVTGSGTTGKITKWTSGSAVGDSIITESGTNITVAGKIHADDWTNVSITESQVSDADWWDEDGDINADEISESKINFVTTCSAGEFYRLNGNDLECTTPTDTNANTICSGTTTYLDGEGNCDDISNVYQPLEATLTDIADGTINENLVNTANPWEDNEVSDTLTCSNLVSGSAVVDISTETNLAVGNGITLTDDTLSVVGGTAITADSGGVSVTPDSIGDTQLTYNTGQHLTTTSDVTFQNVTTNNLNSINCITFDSGGKICSN